MTKLIRLYLNEFLLPIIAAGLSRLGSIMGACFSPFLFVSESSATTIKGTLVFLVFKYNEIILPSF